jgi:hypothetical protein
MSDRQLKLGAAPAGVGAPGQQNSTVTPSDASVNIEWRIERGRQLEGAGQDFIFILDSQFINAHRYGRALEHVTVTRGPWISYEDDAPARDKEAGLFFDPSRQPVIFQAGDSEEDRQLGASVAEGNSPIARSFEENRAKDFAETLAELGRAFGRLDFSQYDLDAPFPAQAVKYGQNSFRTQAEKVARVAREENLSLRETVLYFERRILNRSPAPPRRSLTRSSVGSWARRPTVSSCS